MEKPITKKAAMRILGCSPRTLQRYVQQGKLAASYRAIKHGRESLYDPDQVTALKETIRQEREIIHTPAPRQQATPPLAEGESPGGVSQAALVRQQAAAVSILEAMARMAPQAVVSLPNRLTLTVKETSELSGLPLATIKRALAAGELRAIKTGKGFRIRQTDLHAYIEKL